MRTWAASQRIAWRREGSAGYDLSAVQTSLGHPLVPAAGWEVKSARLHKAASRQSFGWRAITTELQETIRLLSPHDMSASAVQEQRPVKAQHARQGL